MNTLIPHLMIIGLGGGIGAILRYLCTNFTNNFFDSEDSVLWGTFSVNIIGSLLIGLSTAYFYKQGGEDQSLKLLLNIGMLGGLTTFSTFSFETVELIESGQFFSAAFYIISTVTLCVSLCLISFSYGKTIF